MWIDGAHAAIGHVDYKSMLVALLIYSKRNYSILLTLSCIIYVRNALNPTF